MSSSTKVENAVIFIADGLRYDHLPSTVADLGVCIKTVSSSLSSPVGFSSLLTGMNPCRHNVQKWGDVLQAASVLGVEGVNTSYCDEDIALPRVLGSPQSTPLADIQPPFIYVERDLTTHMPYGQQPGLRASEYFGRRGTTMGKIKTDYRDATLQSAAKFLDRLSLLKSRGLLDRTVVVFTSDHGELLGEYGLVGHNSPACPELIYVPTVWIGPGWPKDLDPRDRLMRHIDIAPTILAILGREALPAIDGCSLLSEPFPSFGYSKKVSPHYTATSIWDVQGGHVFLDNSRLHGLAYSVARATTPHWMCARFILASPAFFLHFTKKYRKFGAPIMPREEARQVIDALESEERYQVIEQELDSEVIERLRGLGYLDQY